MQNITKLLIPIFLISFLFYLYSLEPFFSEDILIEKYNSKLKLNDKITIEEKKNFVNLRKIIENGHLFNDISILELLESDLKKNDLDWAIKRIYNDKTFKYYLPDAYNCTIVGYCLFPFMFLLYILFKR